MRWILGSVLVLIVTTDLACGILSVLLQMQEVLVVDA